jgi:hypothetical protein
MNLDKYEIQPETHYTAEEKEFLKFLTQVTGVPIFLGFGPESWTDGKSIVLDRGEHGRALSVACGGDRFDSALNILAPTLSHLMAHIRRANKEEHDLSFFKEQILCMQTILENMIKLSRSTNKTSLSPVFARKKAVKDIQNFEKILQIKGDKLIERVLESIVSIPVIPTRKIDIVTLRAEKLTWTDYLKLMKIIKIWSDSYPIIKTIRRPKNKK